MLAASGLVINPVKCCFAQPSVEFLGHIVTSSGLSPLIKHVEAVEDFPPPTCVKSLQRFLGLIYFYQRFLPAVAAKLKPLTDALAGDPKELIWSPAMQLAFVAAKTAPLPPFPCITRFRPATSRWRSTRPLTT